MGEQREPCEPTFNRLFSRLDLAVDGHARTKARPYQHLLERAWSPDVIPHITCTAIEPFDPTTRLRVSQSDFAICPGLPDRARAPILLQTYCPGFRSMEREAFSRCDHFYCLLSRRAFQFTQGFLTRISLKRDGRAERGVPLLQKRFRSFPP